MLGRRFRKRPADAGRLACMPHRSPLRLAAATVCSAALLLILAVPAGAVTTLRLGGIGPLELGMKRSAALATGWLGNRGTGCELGGDPLPITYRFTGPSAPRGLVGTAEFRRHRLRNLAFSRGVRTGRGVRVRVTTTSRMVSRCD